MSLSAQNKQLRRAVFLDRDGVINRCIIREGKSLPPHSMEELEILPGVPEALKALRQAGYLLIVVTNQPDVATGVQKMENVEKIHAHLMGHLPLDEIRACFHVDADNCGCRKPKPGMLLEAAEKHGVNLADSFMIGDRWRDIEAGRRAGCATILVRGNLEKTKTVEPDAVVDSLAEAAGLILSGKIGRK